MADTLPVNFPSPPSNSLATYDYFDSASGTAYKVYYGVCQFFSPSALAPYATSNPQYFLLDSNATDLYSYDDSNGISTSTTTTATINFDTAPFKEARVVSGRVFINFLCVNGVASTTNCTFSARLYKYDGSTETAITALQTLDFNGNNAPAAAMSANAKINFMCGVDTTDDTLIGVGDKLRLKVVLTNVDAETITVYHDPLGRDTISDTDFSTRLKVKVPFRSFN